MAGLAVFREGRVISARALNDVARHVDAVVNRISGPRQVLTEDGSTNEKDASAVAAVQIARIRVDSQTSNTLVGVLYPDLVTAATVAKPPGMRGNLGTRTVSAEDQMLIPPYTDIGGGAPAHVGEVFAALVGPDHTGLAGVDWQDLNAQGRQWVEDV